MIRLISPPRLKQHAAANEAADKIHPISGQLTSDSILSVSSVV